MPMRNVWFIAIYDLRYQLRQATTLVWLLLMPPVFFYFIGTVTGGFSTSTSGATATPLVVFADSPGFLKDQIDLRLRDNNFAPEWREEAPDVAEQAKPSRTLVFADHLSDQLLAGEKVTASYDTTASSLSRNSETIRLQRSLYTALADITVANIDSDEPLTANMLLALNAEPRSLLLEVSPAGQRKKIPSGFEQAIPGILVMFTLLVLLTSGASMLATERIQGLLRRLAATPISRGEIVAGKWLSRMVLAALQILAATIFGTLLFKMQWGPNLGMVALVLVAWAAFCASAGLLLGSVAKSESQAAGLGVLSANLLAALGGCWWPIEITPVWMQFIQKMLPTGWTMDALHKLISFQAGALSAVPNIAVLLLAAAAITALAIKRFRYE